MINNKTQSILSWAILGASQRVPKHFAAFLDKGTVQCYISHTIFVADHSHIHDNSEMFTMEDSVCRCIGVSFIQL